MTVYDRNMPSKLTSNSPPPLPRPTDNNEDALSDRSDSSRVATYTLVNGLTGEVIAVDKSRDPFKYGVSDQAVTWGYVGRNEGGLRVYNTTHNAKVHVTMTAPGFPDLPLNPEEFEFLSKYTGHLGSNATLEQRSKVANEIPPSLKSRFFPAQSPDGQSYRSRSF
eukprot:Blabericola_migrator_1__9213@NODE_493_length_8037_cov_350_734128_g378_i0_p6_GENE_NODE_493_length_8037_cov_350_734128_g378_i0NODE_493_length_8037_cov_350_734128_g378_i0_p6_ORF_typecomplete_len165_score21_26PBPTp47_c/PF14888_6/0_16_NODE_493_length_8037_cov_350_734128_g378_i043284822